MRQELPGWWRRAFRWLELLSANPVRTVDDFHWPDGSTAVYARSTGGELKNVMGRSWMGSTPRLASAWSTPNPWPPAVQLAGCLDQSPPLACILLIAALHAFREGEYRTCVADAGTAAEVALREALRRINNPARDLDTLRPVAERARASIDGLVPEDFKPGMVDVRNRVIHDGSAVEVESAANASTLAQRVVHAVHSLPEVDDAGLTLVAGDRERRRSG